MSITRLESIMQNPAIDRKMWKYTGDYRNYSEHCRNHAAMNNVIVLKGEPFVLVGLNGETYYPMCPQDPNLPIEEREGCQCILQGIVADEIMGISFDERKQLEEQARAKLESDDKWEYELDLKNRAKAGIGFVPKTYEE